MRIVFAGTQSVGKTTLIEDLRAACPAYRIEEEPIRAVARITGQPPPSIPTRAAERTLVEHGRSRLLAAARVWVQGAVVDRPSRASFTTGEGVGGGS